MPRTRRPLGTEQSPLVRWTPDGALAALVASAPVVDEDAPPAVEEVEEQAPPPAERTPSDQELPPPEGGVPFTIPVVVLEGWETSDGRYIEPGSLGRRDLPQSLMAMTRNPDGGFEGHSAAIVAGRIDTLDRVDASTMLNRETGEPFGPGVWAWTATGYLTPHPDQPGSVATVQYVRDQVLRGVSVDLGEVVADVVVLEEDEDGFPERVRFVVTRGSIAQATITPFAAFPGAYIVLDEGLGAEEAGVEPAPAEEAPSGEEALPIVASSALRILEPARNRQALLASVATDAETIAPVVPPRGWFSRVDVPDPSRHVYLGRRPNGVPTGQTWGYVAQWGVPHAGILDREVYAPRLGPEGYRTFSSQGSVFTEEGEEVPTGVLTFGGGHASTDLGVIPALAHYDNAGSAYADVVIGEDEFGVWFAGAMRPHLTRQQIEEFGRHPVSGDWRANPGDTALRFVAALSVNTPGFPIRGQAHITASGVRSLVAAGSAPIVRRSRQGHGHDEDAVRRLVDDRMRPVLTAAARAGLARLRRP